MTQDRFAGLDALRFVAAAGVVVDHVGKLVFPQWTVPLEIVGQVSVRVFFMISGFVILRSVEATGSRGQFLRRRALRLFPAYLICLAIALACSPEKRAALSWLDIVGNVTMLPKLLRVELVDGIYWTLTHEWMFYLLVALTLPLLRRRAMWVVTGWILAVTVIRGLGLRDPTLLVVLNVDFAFVFGTGMLIHEIGAGRLSRPQAWGFGLMLAAAAASGSWGDSLRPEAWRVGVYLLEYGLYVALLCGFIAIRLRPDMARLAVTAGMISYPLYLIHTTVRDVLAPPLLAWGVALWLIAALCALAALAAAWIVARYLEGPLRAVIASAAPRRGASKADSR